MITWSSQYETGVPVVDKDHQVLVDNLNRLEEAFRQKEGGAHIAELLDFLGRYAGEHFRREETCMEQYRCPVAAANKAAHQQFIQTFAAARARLASPHAATSVAIQVHGELCEWIKNHILKIDLGLRSCARAHPAAGR